MSINDGGPAFPMPIAGCNDGGVYNTMQQSSGEFGGMTLRDYFAAKAMQSLIIEGEGFNSNPDQIRPMTETAYGWADAMLRARTGGAA